jgi:hypothetical protein
MEIVTVTVGMSAECGLALVPLVPYLPAFRSAFLKGLLSVGRISAIWNYILLADCLLRRAERKTGLIELKGRLSPNVEMLRELLSKQNKAKRQEYICGPSKCSWQRRIADRWRVYVLNKYRLMQEWSLKMIRVEELINFC